MLSGEIAKTYGDEGLPEDTITLNFKGSAGQSFGAGMSGGIAYVLDEKGDFKSKCNKQIAEINSLKNDDAETVKKLLRTHYEYTQSAKAKDVFANWDLYEKKFVKVSSPIYEKTLLS